ncbi:MAG TPA: metallophosphoesterase [Phycisphaerae bacterium]|nr:metallophosphoesterase [Phycisphaerae bacterium]
MNITRRDLIRNACAVGAVAMLGREERARATQTPVAASPAVGEPFSFVHLTDIHVTPRRKGDQGYRTCIESVRRLDPKPAFALMGGDMIFDAGYHTKAEVEEYIRLFKMISDSLEIPWYPCMGNHDVLGWTSRRKVAVDDPQIGKKMIMDRLGWEKSHYSFDFAGWHFVMLDSVSPVSTADGPGYEAKIGPEQLEWLAYDLGAAKGKPTVAVTHIPAFCNNIQIAGNTESKGLGGRVITDSVQLRTILERHKVKALLQGHNHRIEEYRLNGVWYLTSAAASGGWWAGDWVGSPPGYTVFRCQDDRLTWTQHTFPWSPHFKPEDKLERGLQADYEAFRAEQQHLYELECAGRKPWPTQQYFVRR